MSLRSQIISSRKVVAAFLVMGLSTLCAQYNPLRHYTVDNGLVSNVVYGAYCDSIGQMWFGTDNGVQMYDGRKFVSYLSSSDYQDNDVFDIYTDHANRIWLSSMFGAQFRVSGDTIIPHKFNEQIMAACGLEKALTQPVHLPSGGIRISLNTRGMTEWSEQGEATSYPVKIATFFEKDGAIFYSGDSAVSGADYILVKLRGQTHRINRNPLFGLSKYDWARSNSYDYLVLGPVVCRVSENGIESFKFEKRVITVFEDSKGRAWVGLLDGGVRLLDSDMDISSLGFLDNKSITGIVEDNDGSYWFTTLYSGIYHVKNLGIQNYVFDSKGNNKIVSLELQTEGLYATLEKGGVYLLNDSVKSLGNIYAANKRTTGQVVDAAFIQGELYVTDFYTVLTFDSYGKPALIKDWLKPVSFTQQGSNALFANNNGFGLYAGDNSVEFFQTIFSKDENEGYSERPKRVAMDGQRWAIATSEGGVLFENNSVTRPSELKGIALNDVAFIDEKVYWASENQGVLIYDTVLSARVDVESGLFSNDVNRLFNDGDSLLWIATDKGLGCYRLSEERLSAAFANANGLINDRVTDVCADQNHVYVASYSGLSILERSGIYRPLQPQMAFLKSEIVDESKGTGDLFKNGPFNAIFSFKAKGISTNDSYFKYRLLGLTEQWDQTTSNSHVYRSLTPGDYIFQVKPYMLSNEGELVEYRFNVPRHWTTSAGFILLCALLGLIVLLYFVKRVRLAAINKVRQGNLMAYFREQTVRSRMDPHFIFNSLNSLQYFLKTKETEKASKYLGTFSKLLRKNIEYSKEDLISLADEIELLQSYCQLESMRFGDELSYDILVDSTLNTSSIFIPAMVIQPLVENAILHGLNGKPGEKWVWVRFTDTGDRVDISVVDNGRGVDRSKSSVKKSKGKHASQMLTERLDIYSQIIGSEYRFERIDAFPEDEFKGTRCLLSFPILRSADLALNRLNQNESIGS